MPQHKGQHLSLHYEGLYATEMSVCLFVCHPKCVLLLVSVAAVTCDWPHRCCTAHYPRPLPRESYACAEGIHVASINVPH